MAALAASPLLNDVDAIDMSTPAAAGNAPAGKHKIVAASLGSLLTALTSA
jgi:hypothetical protein